MTTGEGTESIYQHRLVIIITVIQLNDWSYQSTWSTIGNYSWSFELLIMWILISEMREKSLKRLVKNL